MYNVKIVTTLDSDAVFANNYHIQIIEIGFAEYFLASHRMGVDSNLFENLSGNSLKRDLSNNTTFNPPLFSLVSTFKVTHHNAHVRDGFLKDLRAIAGFLRFLQRTYRKNWFSFIGLQRFSIQ
jgi:hypothetical protein